MSLKFKGKVWVFGDNLDVDFEIVPFRKFDEGLIKLEDVGKWCMTNVDPDFPKKVKKGDIMVAGSNMGCGHDHFQANLAIKQCTAQGTVQQVNVKGLRLKRDFYGVYRQERINTRLLEEFIDFIKTEATGHE